MGCIVNPIYYKDSNLPNTQYKLTTSDESVVKVDENGKATALKTGKAFVQLVYKNEVQKSTEVVVTQPSYLSLFILINEAKWHYSRVLRFSFCI